MLVRLSNVKVVYSALVSVSDCHSGSPRPIRSSSSLQDQADNLTPATLQRAEEAAEVTAGGGEDGADAFIWWSREIGASHAEVVVDMANDGLDGGAAAHLARDGAHRARVLPEL